MTKFIVNRIVGQTVRIICFSILLTRLRVQTLTLCYLAIQMYWKVKNLRHNTWYYSFFMYNTGLLLYCIALFWIRKRYRVCIIHTVTWSICARIKYISTHITTHSFPRKLLWTYMMFFDFKLSIILHITNIVFFSIYKIINLPKTNTHIWLLFI